MSCTCQSTATGSADAPLAGSENSYPSDVEDPLGEWDDAEEDMYQARLEQWEARQQSIIAADVQPGQVSATPTPRFTPACFDHGVVWYWLIVIVHPGPDSPLNSILHHSFETTNP